MTDIEKRLQEFITNELSWEGNPDELTADYPLIEREVIDSMGIFQIVTFLEEHFGVEIDDEEVVIENFENLGAIARLVDSKASV